LLRPPHEQKRVSDDAGAEGSASGLLGPQGRGSAGAGRPAGRKQDAEHRQHDPDLDGLEATRRILSETPTTSDGQPIRVVMLTTFDLDQYVYAALSAGASGFLLKDVTRITWYTRSGWCRTVTRCSPPRSPAASWNASPGSTPAARRCTATWPR
jgi:hypothetical protein